MWATQCNKPIIWGWMESNLFLVIRGMVSLDYWVYGLPYYIYLLLLVGGFNPSEKYESQLGSLFPIYGKS